MEGVSTKKMTANELLRFFQASGVLAAELEAAASERAKSIRIGQFLAKQIGRTAEVEVGGKTGKATLRCTNGAARKTEYHFEIGWDDVALGGEGKGGPVKPSGTSKPRKKPKGQSRSSGRTPASNQQPTGGDSPPPRRSRESAKAARDRPLGRTKDGNRRKPTPGSRKAILGNDENW